MGCKSVTSPSPLGFGSLCTQPKPASSYLAAAAQGLAEEGVARKRDQKAQDKLETNSVPGSARSTSTWRGLGNASKGTPGTKFLEKDVEFTVLEEKDQGGNRMVVCQCKEKISRRHTKRHVETKHEK